MCSSSKRIKTTVSSVVPTSGCGSGPGVPVAEQRKDVGNEAQDDADIERISPRHVF